MSSSDSNSATAIDRENPWPGLASFTEDARAFFFGREKETDEFVRLVRRDTLTVLFGQSGLGKSSLLRAGAFPVLREADFLPLYLRLDHSVAGDAAPSPRSPHPASARAPQLQSTLADQVKAALVAAFKSVGTDAPAQRAGESLWEYFHRKDIDIWSAKNRLLTPVLAFDQFAQHHSHAHHLHSRWSVYRHVHAAGAGRLPDAEYDGPVVVAGAAGIERPTAARLAGATGFRRGRR